MNSIATHKPLASLQNDKAMTENQNTKLQATPTIIPDVLVLEPKVFGDNRGWFTESFNANDFAKATRLDAGFVQDNHSFSRQWTLRGLHYQIKHTQGKLVRVTAGSVFDVAVDLRKNSKTFGKYFSFILTDKSYSSIYIPEGFAHGFCGLDKENIIFYSCSKYRHKNSETGIKWDDEDLKINWPIKNPIISQKDKKNLSLKEYLKII